MKALIGKNMAPLIPLWATTDKPYTYDSTQTRCIFCTYDSLYDYDATACTVSITSSTTVTTTFHGDARFADDDGIIEDMPGDHEQDAAGFGMPLYGFINNATPHQSDFLGLSVVDDVRWSPLSPIDAHLQPVTVTWKAKSAHLWQNSGLDRPAGLA